MSAWCELHNLVTPVPEFGGGVVIGVGVYEALTNAICTCGAPYEAPPAERARAAARALILLCIRMS